MILLLSGAMIYAASEDINQSVLPLSHCCLLVKASDLLLFSKCPAKTDKTMQMCKTDLSVIRYIFSGYSTYVFLCFPHLLELG